MIQRIRFERTWNSHLPRAGNPLQAFQRHSVKFALGLRGIAQSSTRFNNQWTVHNQWKVLPFVALPKEHYIGLPRLKFNMLVGLQKDAAQSQAPPVHRHRNARASFQRCGTRGLDCIETLNHLASEP